MKATHKSTLEITREESLTPRGDCIIAVSADKAAAQLNPELLHQLAQGYHLAVAIAADGELEAFFAQGAPNHLPTSSTSIVIRKSTHLDGRTLAVNSTKAARDLDRKLVEKLSKPDTTVHVYLASAPTRRDALKLLASLL